MDTELCFFFFSLSSFFSFCVYVYVCACVWMPEDNLKYCSQDSTHLFGDRVSHWFTTCQGELFPLIHLPPSLQHWDNRAYHHTCFWLFLFNVGSGDWICKASSLLTELSTQHAKPQFLHCDLVCKYSDIGETTSSWIAVPFLVECLEWEEWIEEWRSKESHFVTSLNQ